MLSYASDIAVDDNKRASENTIWETRNHEVTPTAMNTRDEHSDMITSRNEELAKQRDEGEWSCNIIIHGREENQEQSDDALFKNNMMQQVCGNVTPKLYHELDDLKTTRRSQYKLYCTMYKTRKRY